MPEFQLPPMARKLSDSKRYKHRFEIESDGGEKKYIIAFDVNAEHWTCSCPSCIYRGGGRDCKHLRRYADFLHTPCAPEPEPEPRRKRSPKPRKFEAEALPAPEWTEEQIARAVLGFAE